MPLFADGVAMELLALLPFVVEDLGMELLFIIGVDRETLVLLPLVAKGKPRIRCYCCRWLLWVSLCSRWFYCPQLQRGRVVLWRNVCCCSWSQTTLLLTHRHISNTDIVLTGFLSGA